MNYPTMHSQDIKPYPANQLKESPRCPFCQSDDVMRIHHLGNFRLPEIWFWTCTQCDRDWGFE